MGGVLLLAFLVVPILEIWLIIEVGGAIGAGWTIALLLGAAVLGSWLVKREGARAWRAFAAAATSGRVPVREAADGALVLVGGTLLLAPGFLTDVVGLLMVLPFTRPLVRGLLWRLAGRRVRVVGAGGPAVRRTATPGSRPGEVVEGEVLPPDPGPPGR